MTTLHDCWIQVYDEVEDEDITVNASFYYFAGAEGSYRYPQEDPYVEIVDLTFEGKSIMGKYSMSDIRWLESDILAQYVGNCPQYH